MGCATANSSRSRPLGRGSKGEISLDFNYKVNFKVFIPNFVCVTISQIKDIKHIELDFHSVLWVMPQGWDLGVLGGQKFIFTNIWSCGGMVSRTGYK